MFPINEKLRKAAAFQKVLIPSNEMFFARYGYKDSAPSSSDEVIDLNQVGAQRLTDQFQRIQDYEDYALQREQAAKAEPSSQE